MRQTPVMYNTYEATSELLKVAPCLSTVDPCYHLINPPLSSSRDTAHLNESLAFSLLRPYEDHGTPLISGLNSTLTLNCMKVSLDLLYKGQLCSKDPLPKIYNIL